MQLHLDIRRCNSRLNSHLVSEYPKAKPHTIIILPVVLHGCKTESENRVLRGIFGRKREKITEWRKLYKHY
jgi:hypothetical protein